MSDTEKTSKKYEVLHDHNIGHLYTGSSENSFHTIGQNTTSSINTDIRPSSSSQKVSKIELDAVVQKVLRDQKTLNAYLESAKIEVDQIIEKVEPTINDRVDSKVNKKMIENQAKSTESLAVFVALFTFISIEFQFFQNKLNQETVAGLTLLLLASLITFVGILHYVMTYAVNNNDSEKVYFYAALLTFIFLWLSAVSFLFFLVI